MKRVCISHWRLHTVLSLLNQGKDILFFFFFGACQKFCYTMGMTIALRGAPLTPTTRINLFWQLSQVSDSEAQTFSPNVSGLAIYTLICWGFSYFFQPALQNSRPQFSLLLFLSLSRHKMDILYSTRLAGFLWGKCLLVKFQVCFIVVSDLSAVIFPHATCKARIFLEKIHQTWHFKSCLTCRQFNSWVDQLRKDNMTKR